MQWTLQMAWAFSWIISSLIARNMRADSMISGRLGSTISLAWLIQYSWASASAALGSMACIASMTCSLGMVTRSAPSFFLTCSAEQAAAVPCGPPTARIRVCFIQAAARSRPATCSISPQSLVGRRTTFLPCLCHCGKYIQPWPLKGCENSAVGRPDVDELAQHRRVAAVAGEMDDQQGVGVLELRRHLGRPWPAGSGRRRRTSRRRASSPARRSTCRTWRSPRWDG